MSIGVRERILTITVAAALGACASVGRPPGGPVDEAPPEVVSASIDTNAVGVRAERLELHFNEVVAERPAGVSGAPGSPVTLEAIVLMSPQTGSPKVEWHRESITIEPRGGFRPNTTYRITLLPGVADLRGNVSRIARSYVFSTGPRLAAFGILGRVFDWQAGTAAPGAIVEAIANAGTADSITYVAASDSIGQFDVGPLGPGRYLVRAFIDADRNRDRGVLEKWDTLTVTVTDHRPSVELLAAQRDSAPIGVQRVTALDSIWVRVDLDKPFDPRTQLASSMVAIRRSDSSVVQVEAVMTEERSLSLRRDSTQRPPVTTPATTTPPAANPPAGEPPSVPSARPPQARPTIPSPINVLMVRVNPLTPLKPGERYVITVRAIPNLVGHTGSSSGVFEGPRPPARPPE